MIKNFIDKLRKINNNTFDAKFWIQKNLLEKNGFSRTFIEKNLFKKINELRKYFSSLNNDENFVQTLDNLASIKREVFDFFDNVIVNEDDLVIKKNRLELIQMMCKTFDNYVNFSLIETN